MAIGVGASAPSLTNLNFGRGGGEQDPATASLGLRGIASVGSGLRTGITVVDGAIRTAAELAEARQRARDAVAEQARLERESAAAEQESRREALESRQAEAEASRQSASTVALSTATPPTAAPAPATGFEPAAESTRQTISAAVAAGEAGDAPPRGAFLDVSV